MSNTTLQIVSETNGHFLSKRCFLPQTPIFRCSWGLNLNVLWNKLAEEESSNHSLLYYAVELFGLWYYQVQKVIP